MAFKNNIRCHIPEEKWSRREHAQCDADYFDDEMNKFCHEVVNRDLERRRKLCEENPPCLKIVPD